MKLNKGDTVCYTGKYEPLQGRVGEIVGTPGDVTDGRIPISIRRKQITNATYSARFKGLTYAVKPKDLKVIKRGKMKYEDKAKRWTIGTGEIVLRPICDKKNIVRCVVVQEVTMRLDGTSSVLRANISILPLSKGFRVILFQGIGHKDTTRTVSRWVDVCNLVMNHLRKIDKSLERPVSKFELPSLIDIKRLHPPVKVGDLVVILSTDGVENRYGWLGIVREELSHDRYDLLVKNEDENGYMATYHRDDIEVIDHDEEFLKPCLNFSDTMDRIRDLISADEWLHKQAKELNPNVTDDWSLADCTRVISDKLYRASERLEENGYEYWLEMSKDNGLYLNKKCKTCGSLHPRIVRQIS